MAEVRDWSEEEVFLEEVLKIIDRRLSEQAPVIAAAKTALRHAASSDYNEVALRSWSLDDARAQSDRLAAVRYSPYFGRIDFREEGDFLDERIYVGLATLYDDRGDPIVYDWRAPISTLYYQFNLGPAVFDAPAGRIRGQVTLKRHYEISGGMLMRVIDPSTDLVSDPDNPIDEMLASVLRQNATGHMRQIVRSIQREQDRVIRVKGDVVVVQGPAGSGKTVVALHRAAYLLYALRSGASGPSNHGVRISATSMLVVSPSSIYADYVSRVLPDLGEGQIRRIAFDDYLREELRGRLRRSAKGRGALRRIERRVDHYEYMLGSEQGPLKDARRWGSTLKTSLGILDPIQRYLDHMERKAESLLRSVRVQRENPKTREPEQDEVCSSDEMVRQFRSEQGSQPLASRIQALIDFVSSQISEYGKRPYVPATTERRLRRDWDAASRPLADIAGQDLFTLYKRFWEGGTWLEPLHSQLDSETWRAITDYTVAALNRGEVPYEDILPLLMLEGRYRGFAPLGGLRHCIVDEAQDYTPLHYEYLRCALPRTCTYTIVGDLNQATHPVIRLKDYAAISQVFRQDALQVDLSTCYRSTAEILEWAAYVLGKPGELTSVRRSGVKPTLNEVPRTELLPAAIARSVGQVRASGLQSVAVLCKTREEASQLHGTLRDGVEASLLSDQSGSINPGVYVLPIYLAKGLEFDAVIIADAGDHAYRTEADRRLLYVACTRALHDLRIHFTGRLSRFLMLRTPSTQSTPDQTEAPARQPRVPLPRTESDG